MYKGLFISVAMATFNGSKFLNDQLLSLSTQTLLPDELIIVDDASTDHSRTIINDFAAVSDIAVKLIVNDSNLGHELTFSKALENCTGELIFLCDQDDVWLPHKIQIVSDLFLAHKGIHLVANNATITDEHLNPISETVQGKLARNLILGKAMQGFNLGCATAVSKSLLELALPIGPQPGKGIDYGHDTWLHEVAHICSARLVVSTTLQYYRRHGNAATISDNTIVGSLHDSAFHLSSHLVRSKILLHDYLKRINALTLLVSRFQSGLARSQSCANINSLYTFQNLLVATRFLSSVSARANLLVLSGFFKKRFYAFAMLFKSEYIAFYGIKSFLLDFFTL